MLPQLKKSHVPRNDIVFFPILFTNSQAVTEAALAADWITASRSHRGGCASNRLDHGLKFYLLAGYPSGVLSKVLPAGVQEFANKSAGAAASPGYVCV